MPKASTERLSRSISARSASGRGRSVPTIPTWPKPPYDFECPIDGLGLIVIDMQRDFIEPGGFGEALGNDVRPLGRIVPVVHELLDLFRRLERPIIHTQEGHATDSRTARPRSVDGGRRAFGSVIRDRWGGRSSRASPDSRSSPSSPHDRESS